MLKLTHEQAEELSRYIGDKVERELLNDHIVSTRIWHSFIYYWLTTDTEVK